MLKRTVHYENALTFLDFGYRPCDTEASHIYLMTATAVFVDAESHDRQRRDLVQVSLCSSRSRSRSRRKVYKGKPKAIVLLAIKH